MKQQQNTLVKSSIQKKTQLNIQEFHIRPAVRVLITALDINMNLSVQTDIIKNIQWEKMIQCYALIISRGEKNKFFLFLSFWKDTVDTRDAVRRKKQERERIKSIKIYQRRNNLPYELKEFLLFRNTRSDLILVLHRVKHQLSLPFSYSEKKEKKKAEAKICNKTEKHNFNKACDWDKTGLCLSLNTLVKIRSFSSGYTSVKHKLDHSLLPSG